MEFNSGFKGLIYRFQIISFYISFTLCVYVFLFLPLNFFHSVYFFLICLNLATPAFKLIRLSNIIPWCFIKQVLVYSPNTNIQILYRDFTKTYYMFRPSQPPSGRNTVFFEIIIINFTTIL